jgi:hypothetical protein
MSLSIKIPLLIIMIIISLITFGSFYYNFGDIRYSNSNHKLENIDSQIEKHVFTELVKGNLTEYINKNGQKIGDDTKDYRLIKRQYYENDGNIYSLFAVTYYGINNEIVKREFFRDGEVVYTNYICLPHNGGYLAL